MTSTVPGANAFGEAVRRRLRDLGRSQRWLADQCEVSPQAVGEWLRDGPPKQRAFQIEDFLDAVGDLAPLAGYTRPGATGSPTLAEVLGADARLTDRDRAAILALYDHLAGGRQ
jgi:hypothetical protein